MVASVANRAEAVATANPPATSMVLPMLPALPAVRANLYLTDTRVRAGARFARQTLHPLQSG
jgi:hypothetical protein